jgi:hypothetical protein
MGKFIKVSAFLLVLFNVSCNEDDEIPGSGDFLFDEIRVPEDYSTIQEAINEAENGDVIILSPGTYSITESIIVEKSITITSKFIKSNNELDITNTIITSDGQLDPLILFETNSDGSTCSGLTFLNSLKQVTIHDAIIKVTNCKFLNSRSDALSFEGAGGYVAYNYFENCGDEAIDADNSLDWTVEHNEIINPNDDGLEIRLHNDDKAERKHIIRYNFISGASEDGIQLIDYDGNSQREFHIHHNIIRNSKMVGLGCTVNGNTIEDFNGSYMEEVAYVYNNVFDNNDHGITGANNMLVFNNIITNSKTLGLKKLDNNSKADFNCFYNNVNDFSDSAVGESNIFEDPLLNSDFSLDLNSLCIEGGTKTFSNNNLSHTVSNSDVYGNFPDIGAKEFHGDSVDNIAPTVSAGPDQVVYFPQIELVGEVTDDSLPEGGGLTYLWSLEQGPLEGTVNFINSNDISTNVLLSKQGSYIFKLTVSDGEKTRSDLINIYYVKDFNDQIISLTNDMYIEAEEYRYLVGSARVLANLGASNGIVVNAEPGQGIWAYTEYSLVTLAPGTYYVWVNASGPDSNSNGLRIALNDLEAEIPFNSTTTNTYDVNSWTKITFNNIPEGVYPLRISADEEGVNWDRIFITMNSNITPVP